MATKFQPLNDFVFIKRSDAEEKTPGGLFIPTNAQAPMTRGEVLAVGPGALNDKGERTPIGVWVGDVVVFGKYSGNDVEIEGEKYTILRESEIYGKIA